MFYLQQFFPKVPFSKFAPASCTSRYKQKTKLRVFFRSSFRVFTFYFAVVFRFPYSVGPVYVAAVAIVVFVRVNLNWWTSRWVYMWEPKYEFCDFSRSLRFNHADKNMSVCVEMCELSLIWHLIMYVVWCFK